ncbi:ThuA domain-containing protein [Alteromonadaceae bacterium BrNp21-10]|nr:ThuA domain-containing protein [Alteromonadaceae bacterium BrNp21-10]
MQYRNLFKVILIVASLVLVGSCQHLIAEKPSILVYSKTNGFRHDSIAAGIKAITTLAAKDDISVTASEQPSLFSLNYLLQFDAIVFLNTTGDVLNDEQQLAMEHYIQAGGGFVGIHAAADTEWQEGDWHWYWRLVGGIFNGHPSAPSNVQQAKLTVVDKQHAATKGLPDNFELADEWYDFKNLNPARNDLLVVDESSYQGGKQSEYHPVAWFHEYDGGRAFYTSLGHSIEAYSNTLFLQHLRGGLQYAIGNGKPTNLTQIRPPQYKFEKQVLSSELNEPMSLDFFANGDILIGERPGSVKLYESKTGTLTQVAQVDSAFISELEMGLQGVAVEQRANKPTGIYISYTAYYGEEVHMRLSRFNWVNSAIDMASEKVLLHYLVEQNCCHMGGDIELAEDGSLFLSTGDNTNPFKQNGYGPIDVRAGHAHSDAQRSSANSQDLRGKVIRILPQDDGSYRIPEGNLFSDLAQGRPEIYVMGTRNAFTVTYDDISGELFYGDIGPDAGKYSEQQGSRGYDEINRVTQAGYFGWPLFIGDNQPYRKYDYATQLATSELFDPAAPINDSPNNTGTKALPATQKPLLWYPYGNSDKFPELGNGGRNALVMDVYRANDYPQASRYPDYYDGKLFIMDFMRKWIKAVDFSADNKVQVIDALAPQIDLTLPIDGRFGPDGNLYVLEYGSAWFEDNPDARLSKIAYVADAQAPQKAQSRVEQNAAPAGHQQAPHPGLKLITDNSCLSCHKLTEQSVGPAFSKVASKYRENPDATGAIADKIASGSVGAWGNNGSMPAFAHISVEQRHSIAEFIMTLQ